MIVRATDSRRWALAICATVACATSRATPSREAARTQTAERRSTPMSPSELIVPHPPEGPPCDPSGPIVELSEIRYVKGKPPHRGAIVEARVRNPLASAIWLLHDVGGGLPSAITAVTLSRTSPPPGAPVWSFEGDGGFAALRLPPQADLLLRGIEVDSYSTEDPFVVAFARAVTVADLPVESWAGQAGLSPASGDFSLSRLTPQVERKVDERAAVPLVVRLLCVQRFDQARPGPAAMP